MPIAWAGGAPGSLFLVYQVASYDFLDAWDNSHRAHVNQQNKYSYRATPTTTTTKRKNYSTTTTRKS